VIITPTQGIEGADIRMFQHRPRIDRHFYHMENKQTRIERHFEHEENKRTGSDRRLARRLWVKLQAYK
jgi:hypothetical protein